MAVGVAALAAIPPLSTAAGIALLTFIVRGYHTLIVLLAVEALAFAAAASLRGTAQKLAEAALECAQSAGDAHTYGFLLHTAALAHQLAAAWPLIPATLGLAGLPLSILEYYLARRLSILSSSKRGLSLPAYSMILVSTLGVAAVILPLLTSSTYGAALGCKLHSKADSARSANNSLHISASRP